MISNLFSLQTLFIYLAAINLIAFLAFGIDKLKARKGWWRIPEAVLIWLAVLGGSIGALLGMKLWHHKTLHKKFKYGIPAIILLQLIIAGYIILYPCPTA